MDISDLRTFATVARLGGMNRAAEALHTVQSNVTARVRALEAEIGCPLFDRHSKGVALTAAGRRLLPYADRLLCLIGEALQAAGDDGQPRGALTFGSLETTAALRLAPVLSAYATAHPSVDLILRTGTSCELVEAVLERRLEGAFVCGPISHAELATETVFEEELVVLAAPGVASLRAVLHGGEPRIIVLRASCSYRQRLERLLARQGVPAPRVLELGTLEAIVRSVGAGLGITMLPRSLIGTVWDADAVSVIEVPRADRCVATLFVRRRDAYCSSALRAFVALARRPASPARRVRPGRAARVEAISGSDRTARNESLAQGGRRPLASRREDLK